jgi:hypothetical protein
MNSGQVANARLALSILRKPADQQTQEEKKQAVEQLRGQLARLGDFDVMRGAIATAATYDSVIANGWLTPPDKALFRAQMAYLGYVMAEPRTWSAERGYHSGNPNMSVSYILSLGVIACALPDHPMAEAWSDYATGWMKTWLENEVGPNGEWIPEGSHYGYVSLEPMVSYAVAARRAGFHDFSTDERLKKLLLFFAKMHTPPDPLRGNLRRTGSWGRGTSGDQDGICGHGASLTASDPSLSKALQWMWKQGGSSPFLSDSRLGGYEGCHVDPRLPAEAPAWGTDYFPNLGVVHRAAFNTPNESYLNFLAAVDSERNLDVWTPGVGGIAQWYGRGKPLSTCFTLDTGYSVRHELLRDGVRLARNWGDPSDPKGPFGHYTKTEFGGFASLPLADYVRTRIVNTKPDDRDWFPGVFNQSAPILPSYPKVTPAKGNKLDWTRQLLFMRDPSPSGPAYLVIRDTTLGGEPTAWQFWTLSEKIGTPEQAEDPAAFLADKPGKTLVRARELPAGSRYTALGQFDVDVEYFIASPDKTPRHTLRYGGEEMQARVPEYQDLLHLQLPGDGAYFVAIYPRPRVEDAPSFSASGDGKVILVKGAAGTDYCFLSKDATEAREKDVSFKGTAGAVQERGQELTLHLGAAGEVSYRDLGLAGATPASLRVAGAAMTLALSEPWAAGEFTVRAPQGWSLKPGQAAGVALKNKPGGYAISTPAGTRAIELEKK